MTVRTDVVLADGRELFYYDALPGRPHCEPDLRTLTPLAVSSQVRWDPLFCDYAVIADHRQARTYRPPTDLCPLDPSREGSATEIPGSDYEVVVFENRFPSFALSVVDPVASSEPAELAHRPGNGRCEVLCFSSDHHGSFSTLTPDRVRVIIDAWADRTQALAGYPSIDYVFCFENRGEEIGVTLSHPHGQIYGYPFVPPRFDRAARAARRHQERTGRCLQCTLLSDELEAGARVVTETSSWVAYVPFAARWPYEVRVVPRRHVPDLPHLQEPERCELASVYLDVLRRFDALFDLPVPYIAGWQQAPVRENRDSWHLAAELFTIRRASDKLKYLAGSESGAAVWINDISPESAARRLRGDTDDREAT